MNGGHLRVTGFMNVRSSISSKEFREGAVPSVRWNKQNPATPIWDKHKEIKEEPEGLKLYY